MRLVLIALFCLAGHAAAQDAPRRPRLPSSADTNDAAAYFQWGLGRVERFPEQGYAAFYWAYRLEPSSPQALYAMHIARILRDPPRLVRYLMRDAGTLARADVKTADSLRLLAEMHEPFLHRGMDELPLRAYARSAPRTEEWFGRSENAGTSGIERRTEQFFEDTDPYLRGRLYYSNRVLRNAIEYYTIALRNRDVGWLWAERGRAWAQLRQPDSAATSYLSALRADLRESNMPLHVFEGPAPWWYALGRVEEMRNDTSGARVAYEEAVHQNRGFYPANLRLGEMAVERGDTASAQFRIGLATEGDPPWWVLTTAAELMSRLDKPDSVVALLERATAKEPLASAGWLLHAQALAVSGRNAEAIRAYERYLAVAPRNDASRPLAEARLAQLRQ